MEHIDLQSSAKLPGTEEDMLERMLVCGCQRSESITFSSEVLQKNSASVNHRLKKRWGNLGNKVICAVNGFKQALALEGLADVNSKEQCRKAVWGGILVSLTERYPGSQLPEKLLSTLRSHFDSLPLSYLRSGYGIEDVFEHIRLLEKVVHDELCEPSVVVQELCETRPSSNASDLSTSSSLCSSCFSEDESFNSIKAFKVAFACLSTLSRTALSCTLEAAGIAVKQLSLFEKKGITLGVGIVWCRRTASQCHRLQAIVHTAIKKSKARLILGLCGSEASSSAVLGDNANECAVVKSSTTSVQDDLKDADGGLNFETDNCSHTCVDARSPSRAHQEPTGSRRIIVEGKASLESYLLESSKLYVDEQIAVGSSGIVYKAYYDGELVAAKKMKGCLDGKLIDMELRQDVLGLITSCNHENVLPLYGICPDVVDGMYLVMKYMEGGSLSQFLQKTKQMRLVDVISIAGDIAGGMAFLHERGIVHRDLKSSAILLDGRMRAVIGDLGIVNNQKIDIGEREIKDYRWMAPEATRLCKLL
eukprot:c17031_g1_i1 orf=310-1911(+)